MERISSVFLLLSLLKVTSWGGGRVEKHSKMNRSLKIFENWLIRVRTIFSSTSILMILFNSLESFRVKLDCRNSCTMVLKTQ